MGLGVVGMCLEGAGLMVGLEEKSGDIGIFPVDWHF